MQPLSCKIKNARERRRNAAMEVVICRTFLRKRREADHFAEEMKPNAYRPRPAQKSRQVFLTRA
jgi:hypothetical protein